MLTKLAGPVGLVLLAALATTGTPDDAAAGAADVTAAQARKVGNVYNFEVTVRSEDAGWHDYADRIEVLAPDGTVLGTRVLVHPHIGEQPFTRDVYGVRIPAGIDRVILRAHHSRKGYDGTTMTIELQR